MAVACELIQPDETFQLTGDQANSIDTLLGRLADGDQRMLLVAPTGSGKTEVFFRVASRRVLDSGRHCVILVPTRDLARQQYQYIADRIENTDLDIAQMHGGVPPRERRDILKSVENGQIQFIVGSAMLLQHQTYRGMLESSALLVVDDVNAFDEDEDLKHLVGLKAQILFTSATPDAVSRFLKKEGAWTNRVEMKQMPFDSPPTEVHRVQAGWNENIFSQIDRGMPVLDRHIQEGSRIYVISRTRTRVPVIAQYLQDRLKVPVSMLHGDMADSSEHRRRMRRSGQGGKAAEDRVSMMRQFRSNSPAILVATNLVGSGLDIPMADMVLVTDADHFGVAEIEQLMGRVGRRALPSDAVLVQGTIGTHAAFQPRVKATSYVRKGKVVSSFKVLPHKPGRGRRRRV
ncbi:MAG: helicase-related protein [Candidatus Eremiobacterota bacterium]